MTKEETIDMIIDDYKNGSQSAMGDYCNGTRCDDCQFDFNDCMNDVAKTLTERLLKAEESQKAETNFDHFIKNYFVTTYENKVTFKLKEGWKETFENFDIDDFKEWLLSPYEEPKPTYKLSRFEYDLLKSLTNLTICLPDYSFVKKLIARGYFKDAPEDICIQYILDNCEVVD